MIAPDPFQPLSRTHPPAEHAPRVLDIFCGAGGFSLGFSSEGFQIAAGVEVDTHAAYTFEHNVSYFQGRACRIYGGPERGDMRTLQPEEVLEEVGPCDVIVGGPPCKAFSRIGRGKLNSLSEQGYLLDPRNRLYHNFLHFLEVFTPRAFVMENVTGMLSMEGRNVADVAARELSRPMGEDGVRYEVRYAVLDASWYGVPQYRQRVIFMGIRSDLGLMPSFPARQTTGSPSHTGYMRWPTEHEQQELFGGELRKRFTLPVPSMPGPRPPVTVSEALDDLPRIKDHLRGQNPSSDWRETEVYRPEPSSADISAFARLMRDWDGPSGTRDAGVNAHFIRLTPRDFETFRAMAPGHTYPDAHALATARLEEHLQELEERGVEPDEEELKQLRQSIVPPYPNDGSFVDRWQKFYPDRPSWTVTAHLSHDTYSHIHHDSDQARAISVREAARLQSFPDRFWFGPAGGMREAFSQIGNAVPPLMAAAIARHLRGLLERA